MYIRDLSARTGFTPDTIRFYEKMNLLRGNRPRRQGHRQYDESHVAALLQIKFAKAMGFTLKDIQEKLTNWDQLSATEKQAILTNQLEKMDEAAAEIEQVRMYLQKKLVRLEELVCSSDSFISHHSPVGQMQ